MTTPEKAEVIRLMVRWLKNEPRLAYRQARTRLRRLRMRADGLLWGTARVAAGVAGLR